MKKQKTPIDIVDKFARRMSDLIAHDFKFIDIKALMKKHDANVLQIKAVQKVYRKKYQEKYRQMNRQKLRVYRNAYYQKTKTQKEEILAGQFIGGNNE